MIISRRLGCVGIVQAILHEWQDFADRAQAETAMAVGREGRCDPFRCFGIERCIGCQPLNERRRIFFRLQFIGDFDLPLDYPGSDFQRGVWNALLRIPYGGTRRYGDLATLMDQQDYTGARAVGTACGQNPIAIIIPCHRVIGTTQLGGYSSDLGLTAKRFLLDLEKGQGRLF